MVDAHDRVAVVNQVEERLDVRKPQKIAVTKQRPSFMRLQLRDKKPGVGKFSGGQGILASRVQFPPALFILFDRGH